MAKMVKSMIFKNATISLSDMKIVEVNKDDCDEFELMDVLKQWDGVAGISLSIRQDSTLPSDVDGGDSG